jgi:thiamine kinase-like enzyme
MAGPVQTIGPRRRDAVTLRIVGGAELLQNVVEREVLAEHAGMSGAGLERVRLADGRRLVVKRITPQTDLTLRLTGEAVSGEYFLWRAGALHRLPAGVGHALVDAWVEDEVTVLVMRDLGDAVLTWRDRLDADQTRMVLDRVARLHRSFLGEPPADLCPLEHVLDLFAPHRIGALAEEGNELARLTLRGWELFAELVDDEVVAPVLRLLADVRPLAGALLQGPVTLLHGDLATVNMALEDGDLVLLDWTLATAGPGVLDVARFLAGCSSVVGLEREQVLSAYELAAGPAHDRASVPAALLAGLLWLGWNKALDAAENPDEGVREREAADLDWWVRRAREALEEGVVTWS